MVEILAVLHIFGFLASLVVIEVSDRTSCGHPSRITRVRIHQLKAQVELFHLDHHRYPDNIDEMVDDYIEEVPLDGWDREFVYNVPGARGARFDIVSYGDDGRVGGEDFDTDLWSSPAK